MSEFLFFLLAAVSAGFCFWPFFRRHTVEALSTRDTPLGRVQQRKETLLQNISDLDFEYRMGKLAENDYENLRSTLKSQAAETIEQIDVLAESDAMIGREPAPQPATPAPSTSSAPTAPSAGGAAFCTQCGTALTPGARFCSSCGNQLA